MEIDTKQFGKVEIDRGKIIHMPFGIPGFKGKKRYAFLQREDTVPFFIFQSVDDPNLALIVLDPTRVIPEYAIEQQDIEPHVSWDFEKEEISCFVIVTVPGGAPEDMTGNFAAPLVINNKRREGLQLIYENSPYSHQQPLLKK